MLVDTATVIAYVHREEVNESHKMQQWLNDIVRLPGYYSNFVENGYESMGSVMKIKDKSALSDIGIDITGHQMRLLAQIEKLRDVCHENEGDGAADSDAVDDDGETKEGFRMSSNVTVGPPATNNAS